MESTLGVLYPRRMCFLFCYFIARERMDETSPHYFLFEYRACCRHARDVLDVANI